MRDVVALTAVVAVVASAFADRPVLTARPIDMQNMGQVTIGPAGGLDSDATVVYSNTTNQTGYADAGTAPDGQTYWGDDFVMIAGSTLDGPWLQPWGTRIGAVFAFPTSKEAGHPINDDPAEER